MATIYINEMNNRATKFDIIRNQISETWARTGGASATTTAMQNILEDACINTNHTFEDNGKTVVSLAEWDKEFTRNVEFIMCMSEDAVAVGNLKHYGFKI